jgi:peptidoglycan hydrolase CwlO-like protein
VAAAAVLVSALLAPAVAAGAQADAEAERDDVRRRRSAVGAELDVLTATDARIEAELDELDRSVAAQRGVVVEAQNRREEASAAVEQARVDLARARRDVARLEAAIREMAVASYVHPPSADIVQALEAASFSDALLQRAYLDARAKRDLDLLDLLEKAEAAARTRAAELEEAVDEAERAAEAAADALAGLQAEQQDQVRFAVRLQARIDASLAEAAVLADLDAELAAEIEAEQAALLARIPAPAAAPASSTPAASTTRPSAPAPTPGAPPTTAPRPSSPPPPPPSSGPAPPLRTVQGITVHADIAGDVDALLSSARAAGILLSGWGYRSSDRQVQLRMQNCGPSYYDVWLKPASLCTPPTAVPGRSLHERGRAIDFTHGGRTITSRSSPAFRWLADHASGYGLFNLPSEPWHWSTNGS